MLRVYMLPQLDHSQEADGSNTIHQIVVRLAKYLPNYGVEVVNSLASADVIASHAGMGQEGQIQADVAICHGLYPTGEHTWPVATWHWGANKNVISDLRVAKRITVPSTWVGEIISRDMHIKPTVIPWAIEQDEWEPGENKGYVLWAKTRADGVCDPTAVTQLAARAPQTQFLTTFGSGTPNIQTIGRQPFHLFKDYIRNAGVYLSTTKETFGITTLEAMCTGVPVLGFRWGGTADIVQHGVTGYLAEPGDWDGLRDGLDYVLRYRDVLGANAREVAKTYTWDSVAKQFADVFKDIRPHEGPKVSVVIPCHNYGKYVGQAIRSVNEQRTAFEFEVIVVLDRCTDDSATAASAPGVRVEQVDYGNPADTRNYGISHARGEYIVCLDADDALGDTQFLQTLADALDQDRRLGMAFTGLRIMDVDGNLGGQADWPRGYDFDAQIQKHNQVPTCCMFRKVAWERAGGYRRRYVPAEDADLWLRIGSLGFMGKQVTTAPWFVYRLHAGSLSGAVRTGKMTEPEWARDKPWVVDHKRPFASDGKNQMWSWPVHNYDNPKVTFVVPCAGKHRWLLPEALDSIECQTERHWECIVVNDGEGELESPAYPWIRVINTGGNRGAGYARNLGVRSARAPMIAFLDADDMLDPRFLELTLRAFYRTGRYVYTDWTSLNKEGQYEVHETPNYIPGEVFKRTSIHSINVLIPKSTIVSVGGFDEDMKSWEDVDFFMKIAAAEFCGVRVPEPLVLYRYSTGSLREHGETIKPSLIALLRERYIEYIEGTKMCGCTTPKQAKSNGIGIATVPNGHADDELVRIEYRGPTGQHTVVGAVTKKNYGRRADGDTFLVYAIDQQDQPTRFLPAATPVEMMQETVIPPEPVLI